MKRFISTTTILGPYGLVRISGEVSRNPDHDGYQQEPYEPLFDVDGIEVQIPGIHLEMKLEDFDMEKIREVLIEKFLDDEGFEADRLIDEAIESGRQYRHFAYA